MLVICWMVVDLVDGDLQKFVLKQMTGFVVPGPVMVHLLEVAEVLAHEWSCVMLYMGSSQCALQVLHQALDPKTVEFFE